MVHGTHNAEADERNKDIKIFINGELLHRDDAKISVFDSGYSNAVISFSSLVAMRRVSPTLILSSNLLSLPLAVLIAYVS